MYICLVSQLCPTLWTPWTIAHQALLFMRILQARAEYWSGLPCPPPGDIPNPRIKPRSPALQADSSQLNHQQGSPRILEWVGYPFCRGTSQPRNRTGISCIAGGFFSSWARGAVTLQGLSSWCSPGLPPFHTLPPTPFCSLPSTPLCLPALQARILEWIAVLSSKGSSQPRDQTHVSYVYLHCRQVLYH